jgi:hypothetical protein
MSLSQLRSLVRRFVGGEISYPVFRSQFVAEYLSILHQDSNVERDVNAIESACADFDEGDILDSELQSELSLIANSPIVSVETNAAPPEGRSSRAIYLKSHLQVA